MTVFFFALAARAYFSFARRKRIKRSCCGFLDSFVHQSMIGRRISTQFLEQTKKLEKAGAFAVVLEMVPEGVGKYITENVSIPTIACGGGKYCDGQVLVCDDIFGKFSDFKPKFARRYANMQEIITQAASKYNSDVKSGSFPSDEEVFHLSSTETDQLKEELCCCIK